MKKYIYLFIIAITTLLLASCNKHDPSYDNVTKPEVTAANSTVSGYVTDYQGNPLANASIQINGTETRTDAKGFYTYDITKEGTYDLCASYPEKFPQSAVLEVASISVTQHYTQNFRLASSESTEIHEGQGSKDSETISGNELEGTITTTTTVQVEASQIPEGEKLYLTPVYSQEDAEYLINLKGGNTHTEYRILAGTAIHCSDPDFTELKSPARVILNACKEVQGLVDLKMYNKEDDEWYPIEYESFDDRIEFNAVKLTVYAIFSLINITIEESSAPITDFKPQDFWDNYTGANTIHVDAVDFTRQAGYNLDAKQGVDQLRALLLEKLAQDYGLGKAQTINETYNLNVDLPVGTAMSISGYQKCLHVTYEKNGKSVYADIYDNTVVTPKTYNRVHTGGGNYVTY